MSAPNELLVSTDWLERHLDDPGVRVVDMRGYVVTRPLGASFADWFSKPAPRGLGLGDGPVSAVGLVAFVALVAYVARSRSDIQPHRHPHQAAHYHLHLPQVQPAEG